MLRSDFRPMHDWRSFTWYLILTMCCGQRFLWAGDALRPIPSFENGVRPFIEQYCIDCHGEDEPEGDLSFESYHTARAITEDVASRKIWWQAARQIRGSMMPPEGSDQPPPTEREQMAAWIQSELRRVDCSGLRNPGRVTLRRLNRLEYRNTVRDLLDVVIDPTRPFPRDDMGYGFDNIGDVLSLSPLHIEKYLDAAELLADAAILAPEEITEPMIDINPGQVRGGQKMGDGQRILATNGKVSVEVTFPVDGRYLFRVKACAQQAGDELAKMEFFVGDQRLKVVEVAAEPNEPQWYGVQLDVKRGRKRASVAFINDYYQASQADPRPRDRNLIIVGGQLIGPIDAALKQTPQSHDRLLPMTPAINDWRDDRRWREVAHTAIHAFASRAFRRPARQEEVDALIGLVDAARRDGLSYERGMQHVVVAVLISPHFLFRGPIDPRPGKPGTIWPIDEYELASRLSYFLWSTMPDEELLRHARDGTLCAQLDDQVGRMLADPRSQALVESFVGQWLEIRRLAEINLDPDLFVEFDNGLRAAMAEEPELLFGEVMEKDLSIMTLLDADFTYVNERLAKHYGMDGVVGDQMRRVTLPSDSRRGGVLMMAGTLTVTSDPNHSSPVKRGKWVLDNLLNDPPPQPPAASPLLENVDDVPPGLSRREQFELHRANPVCASCHVRMDPIGFSLENYDAIGRWREKQGEHVVDAVGVLPDGTRFDGPEELKQILLKGQDEFRRCFIEKLLTYALGRGLEYYDQCTVDEIAESLQSGDDRFSTLVLAIVGSDPFQKRRVDGDKK